MEVAIEAVMAQVDVQLLHDVLHNEQLSVLDCLLECFLNVPEHEILELGLLSEYLLETIQVSLDCAVDKGSTSCHEAHKAFPIILFHGLNFLPKPPRKQILGQRMLVLTYMR